MSVAVFALAAAPEVAPTKPVVPQLTHTWTGWDGSVWPINKKAGLWFDNGIRGLGIPSYTHFKRTPVSINGSVWYGYIIPEREVFWPLWSTFSEEQDRAFWKTLLPYQTGTWTVQAPSGQSRSIDLRITDDGGWAPAFNPFLIGVASYSITLAAEQPLWRGTPVWTSWGPPDRRYLFGGGDPNDPDAVQSAPPLYISRDSDYDTAQLVNEGEVEQWPVWVVDGPCTTASVGIGTELIGIPFAVPDGKRLKIDTDPTVQQALLGDPDPNSPDGLTGTVTDQTRNLQSPTWGMIPPGGAVDVSITFTGSPTQIGVMQTPLYLRAW